jgi:protein-disulfide isomerase
MRLLFNRMPSGKRARQQRQQAAAATAPPPVRSKGVGGARPRQASPRALAIGGGVIAVVIIAILLAIILSRGNNATNTGNFPAVGSRNWSGALLGAPDAYNLFKGIPQHGLTLGSPNAPATLTEYIDLQCPVCRDFETTELPTIVPKYVRTGQLNIKMQPWSIRGPDSNRGQAATIAASLQNRAFPFSEMLYYNQGTENTGWLNDTMVQTAASSVDGLKPAQVLSDAGSSQTKSIVNSVDATAAANGFNATPTLLLNHKGQKPRVVAAGLPNLATLESQIQSAING